MKKYKLFDGHLHHFVFPVPVRESIDLYRRQFKRFNIKKFAFLALPCDPVVGRYGIERTDRVDNLRSMYFKKVFSPNGYAYAGLEYIGLDLSDKKAVAQELLRQVAENKKVGYDGMKMYEAHPNMHATLGYDLDDEVYDLYFDFCEKEKFPIIMHIANAPYMWDPEKVNEYWRNRGCLFTDKHPTFDGLHQELLRRLKKNPKLNLTVAHFGFMTFNKTVMEEFMSFENTRLDVCPGTHNYFNLSDEREYWRPFFIKYQDRICYGTDSYNFEYENEENWLRATGVRPILVQRFLIEDSEIETSNRTIKGFKLDKKILNKIFYDNLNNLLGEPNKIDLEYFYEKCKKLLEETTPSTRSHYDLWCMKNDFETFIKGEKIYYE